MGVRGGVLPRSSFSNDLARFFFVSQPGGAKGQNAIAAAECAPRGSSRCIARPPRSYGPALLPVLSGTLASADWMRAAGGIQRGKGRNTLWLLSTSMLLLQSSAQAGSQHAAGQPPPAPPAPPSACPLYHTGRKQYDPSGPILMPDGTWVRGLGACTLYRAADSAACCKLLPGTLTVCVRCACVKLPAHVS